MSDEYFCLKFELFRIKLFSTLGNDRGSDRTDGDLPVLLKAYAQAKIF